MKKIFALLLALVMTLSLVACGGNAGNDQQGGDAEGSKKIETLKVAFVPSREPEEIITATEPLKQMLTDELAKLGYDVGEVDITVGTSYEAVGEALAAGLLDLGHGLLDGGLAAARADDLHAALGKAEGDALANALAGSGDDGDLLVELLHVVLLSWDATKTHNGHSAHGNTRRGQPFAERRVLAGEKGLERPGEVADGLCGGGLVRPLDVYLYAGAAGHAQPEERHEVGGVDGGLSVAEGHAAAPALGLSGEKHGKLDVKAQRVCDLALDLDHAASRGSGALDA